ncbi:MAG: prepilin-type N-terminal cleavage/methylation domain-containing protein [Candidatus Marinimicrobia bacterium]|nr:prepilin-type N-terminal cleavage/methylation domain-containing protein [Candidatus Neomarinimicrobiota bacterium]
MDTQTKNRQGFSLIELMIVIVISGVLAAIGIAIFNKNIVEAKRTEAVASIGTIRRQLRLYYAAEGTYPLAPAFTKVVGKPWNDIKPGELTGRYFSDTHYRYRSYDGIAYRIKCQKAGILDKNIWIDETGNWKFNVLDDD